MNLRDKLLNQSLAGVAGLWLALSGGPAVAQSESGTPEATAPKVAETPTPDPYTMPDESWVSIYGKVRNSTPDGFDLDIGENVVRVEMDDHDGWPEARGLTDGLDVAVVGKVDDDLFELTSVEAGTVYIGGLNTVFWASPEDEEQWGDVAFYRLPDLSNVVLEGTITDIDVQKGTFSLSTGTVSHVISVEELGYNPFDEIGYQKLSEDDRVRVTSHLDADAVTSGQLDATSLVSLRAG